MFLQISAPEKLKNPFTIPVKELVFSNVVGWNQLFHSSFSWILEKLFEIDDFLHYWNLGTGFFNEYRPVIAPRNEIY